jgi:hypothetical protein
LAVFSHCLFEKIQVPHIDDIHEIKAAEPEECILAMGVDVPLLPSTFNLLMDKKDMIMEW